MLKKFLGEALELNERSISAGTLNKVRKLIGELLQPSVVKPLSRDKYYILCIGVKELLRHSCMFLRKTA